MTVTADNRPQSRRGGIVLFAAIVLLLLFFTTDLKQGLQDALKFIDSLGPWGPVLFVALYVLACVLLIPGSILTLGAGALFGVVKGTVLVSLGSVLGAVLAFLIGRHFTRNWVEAKLKAYPRFAAIDQAVSGDGWKIVFLTRLSPLFPFALLNYAFGLTKVSLRDYVTASAIGMLPGTILYVYLGSLAAAGATDTGRSPAQWALLIVGLLATIVVTVMITTRARAALNQKLADTSSAKTAR